MHLSCHSHRCCYCRVSERVSVYVKRVREQARERRTWKRNATMEIKDKNKSDKLSYCTIYTEFYLLLLLLMLPACHAYAYVCPTCLCAGCATAAAAAEDDTCESIIFHLALLVFVFKALLFSRSLFVADRFVVVILLAYFVFIAIFVFRFVSQRILHLIINLFYTMSDSKMHTHFMCLPINGANTLRSHTHTTRSSKIARCLSGIQGITYEPFGFWERIKKKLQSVLLEGLTLLVAYI